MDNYIFDINNNLYQNIGNNKWVNIKLVKDKKIKKAIFSISHSLYIDEDDILWYYDNSTLVLKIDNIKFKKIYLGDENFYIIDDQNNVYVYGYNLSGQLGLGHSSTVNKLTLLEDIKTKKISAGNTYALIIDKTDNLYFTGFLSNSYDTYDIRQYYVPTSLNMKAKYIYIHIKKDLLS